MSKDLTTLSALADINPKTSLPSTGTASFVGMEDVSESFELLNSLARPVAESGGYTRFKEGDLLFAKITPCMENGKGAEVRGLISGAGFGSTEFHVLRPKNPLSSRFIAQWLKYPRLRLDAEAHMSGSAGQRRVPSSFFERYQIPSLSLNEQRQAGEILDTVDEQIQKSRQVIAKLRLAKQGLLVDLLTLGVDQDGNMRDLFRHPDQFKDTILGKVPKSWDVSSLPAMASGRRPYLKTGPFGSSLKEEHWVERGIPVVTIGSLGEGRFIASELLYVSSATASRLRAYSLRAGDVVFSRVADVGRSVAVTEAEEDWIMSSNMMWISLDPHRVRADYLQANLAANPRIRGQVRRQVNSSGRDVANAAVLNSLIFTWAPMEEQEAIARILEAFQLRIDTEHELLVKLELLKHGMMEGLLTGRIRLPAEVTS